MDIANADKQARYRRKQNTINRFYEEITDIKRKDAWKLIQKKFYKGEKACETANQGNLNLRIWTTLSTNGKKAERL